jgi:hypothetical protein
MGLIVRAVSLQQHPFPLLIFDEAIPPNFVVGVWNTVPAVALRDLTRRLAGLRGIFNERQL